MAKKANEERWARAVIQSFWIALTGTIGVLIYIVVLAQNLPSIEQLENFDPDLVTGFIHPMARLSMNFSSKNVCLLS